MCTLGERLKKLRNLAGLTAKAVKDSLNIADLGRFEKDERKPSIDTLLTIANFYNVTTDWLLTGEGEMYKARAPNLALSSDKARLLEYYERLSEDTKRDELVRLQTIVEYQEKERQKQLSARQAVLPKPVEPEPEKAASSPIPKLTEVTAAKGERTAKSIPKKNPVPDEDEDDYEEEYEEDSKIPMQVAVIASSAGIGNALLSDDFFETWYVDENKVPSRADFGVKIDGDSMEPILRNGTIAWVRKADQVDNGRVGIFVLNGDALCKRLKIDYMNERTYLISENKKYKPILINEYDTFTTVGEVILPPKYKGFF